MGARELPCSIFHNGLSPRGQDRAAGPPIGRIEPGTGAIGPRVAQEANGRGSFRHGIFRRHSPLIGSKL